jgi:signal transduction histidine kinase
MPTYTLKRMAFLSPVLFIGAVLFAFTWLDPAVSWRQALPIFVVLAAGAIGFTVLVFGWIEQREGEARWRSDQLSALYRATLALTEELDLSTVLQLVVDQARTLADAKYGALGVLDEKNIFFDQFITSGITPEQRARLGRPPLGHGLLGVLIKDGESLQIPDISTDPRGVGFPPNHPPMRSLLGVPIKFKDKILGDLYLTDKMTASGQVTNFSDQDQRLLEMFASQAAIAIKNAQLYRQSQELALLQERERFGMDLHDGVIQSIYAIGLMLEDAQYQNQNEGGAEGVRTNIARSIDGLNDVIRDIRTYILDLRPQRFQGRFLPEGLAELVREVRAHSFLDVDLQIGPWDWPQLSSEYTVEILHIAREALTNIRKHSRASQVVISLTRQPKSLELKITDNGIGFDAEQAMLGTGNGLHNMQERAQLLNGNIVFVQRVNKGTSVEISIPLALYEDKEY